MVAQEVAAVELSGWAKALLVLAVLVELKRGGMLSLA
jgi:hypothetical protein